jgi:nucleotide-binding universal stress UspA family protein
LKRTIRSPFSTMKNRLTGRLKNINRSPPSEIGITLVFGMIAKILFPVDFSPACTGMAPYVKRAADMFGARVTIIYVCDLASHNGFELYVRAAPQIAEEHLCIGEEHLRTFLRSEFPDCDRVLRSGEAAQVIAEVARSGSFDLIVMPTHAGHFRRMLLGSTTAKVLNDADCPVMTTSHAEAGAPRPLEHRVWVCAIGLSEDSERVLNTASSAATAVGATLLVAHATDEVCEDDARERLEEVLLATGCKAEIHISVGRVKEAILRAAYESAADALIVGRRLSSRGCGRLGDLSYSLIRDSPVPVISV